MLVRKGKAQNDPWGSSQGYLQPLDFSLADDGAYQNQQAQMADQNARSAWADEQARQADAEQQARFSADQAGKEAIRPKPWDDGSGATPEGTPMPKPYDPGPGAGYLNPNPGDDGLPPIPPMEGQGGLPPLGTRYPLQEGDYPIKRRVGY